MISNKNTENILGYQISTLKLKGCIDRIVNWIESGCKNKVFICSNPHSLVTAENDLLFKKAIQTADMLTPDGVGILMASNILGGKIKKRVTGSDVFYGLSNALNKKEKGTFSYFFLGSNDQTLEKIINKLGDEYPNIRVAGTYSPPFKTKFSEEETRGMINAVNHSKPDILWVGMTAPKQEKWIYQNKNELDTKFIGAVGAVFDFYAGNIKRSHPVFQQLGLEWLPRLIQEPQRLWHRNFVSNPTFIMKILAHKFGLNK